MIWKPRTTLLTQIILSSEQCDNLYAEKSVVNMYDQVVDVNLISSSILMDKMKGLSI